MSKRTVWSGTAKSKPTRLQRDKKEQILNQHCCDFNFKAKEVPIKELNTK